MGRLSRFGCARSQRVADGDEVVGSGKEEVAQEEHDLTQEPSTTCWPDDSHLVGTVATSTGTAHMCNAVPEESGPLLSLVGETPPPGRAPLDQTPPCPDRPKRRLPPVPSGEGEAAAGDREACGTPAASNGMRKLPEGGACAVQRTAATATIDVAAEEGVDIRVAAVDGAAAMAATPRAIAMELMEVESYSSCCSRSSSPASSCGLSRALFTPEPEEHCEDMRSVRPPRGRVLPPPPRECGASTATTPSTAAPSATAAPPRMPQPRMPQPRMPQTQQQQQSQQSQQQQQQLVKN